MGRVIVHQIVCNKDKTTYPLPKMTYKISVDESFLKMFFKKKDEKF